MKKQLHSTTNSEIGAFHSIISWIAPIACTFNWFCQILMLQNCYRIVPPILEEDYKVLFFEIDVTNIAAAAEAETDFVGEAQLIERNLK